MLHAQSQAAQQMSLIKTCSQLSLLTVSGASDAGPRVTPSALPAPPVTPDALGGSGNSATAASASTLSDAATLPAAAALPRMPMGLAYVSSRRCYDALAAAMRTAGHLAAETGAGEQGISSFPSPCLSPLACLTGPECCANRLLSPNFCFPSCINVGKLVFERLMIPAGSGAQLRGLLDELLRHLEGSAAAAPPSRQVRQSLRQFRGASGTTNGNNANASSAGSGLTHVVSNVDDASHQIASLK